MLISKSSVYFGAFPRRGEGTRAGGTALPALPSKEQQVLRSLRNPAFMLSVLWNTLTQP